MRNAKKQIKKQTLRQVALDPDNELPDDVGGDSSIYFSIMSIC